MADILGKDLDLWENSTATESPFNLKAEDTQLSKYISGGDLLKSLKINQNMKVPVEMKALSYDPTTPKFIQPFISMGRSAVDAIVNAPDNLKNLAAQIAVERLSGDKTEKSAKDKIIDSLLGGTEMGELNRIAAEGLGTVMTLRTMKDTAEDIKDKAKTYDEAIDLLNDREYPIAKYARRVLAETTDNVETRRVVHELYNQAQGIDSSKWYNQAGTIIGAMLPDLALTRGVYKGARLLGAGRANAVRAATNIMTGVVGVEEAGRYAEETAAQYVERTGDKTFENFTAKDATGLSAMAYGAISGRIEFMGGVEPIVAGAITKIGLRSSLGKAFTKSALQEGAEEFGQGIAELLTRKIDGTSDKTWKQGFEEALTGAVWGALIGGPIGTTAFYTNRRNLVKGIKNVIPNINDTQAQQIADAMIDSTAEMSTQDSTLRGSLRQKVELMYRDSDIENKEDIIDATTDLEYSLIAMDSAERGIDLADNSLFNGEVNELGWFREGIPTARREEVQAINDEIKTLKTQLAELNKAEEKDWAKIDELENKLAQANQYVLDKLSELARNDSASVRRMFEELEGTYVAKEKERALDSFKATTEQKELANGTANLVLDTLAKEGIESQVIGGQNKQRAHGSSYLLIKRPGTTDIKIRFGVTPIGSRHSAVVANFNVETVSQEEILSKIRNLIKEKSVKNNKTKDVNVGFESATPTIFQNRVSGGAPATYRGAYIPEYRFILRANRMDASTLSHELAHDWFEVNFNRYRSGNATKDFMRAWGALEKALGVPEDARIAPRKASEVFARAYEAWITSNEDWSKFIAVEDKDKDKVEKLLKDYQSELRDIYNDINNKYFKATWGKLGELKPELKTWFDRVINITDLDTLVERGEITEEEASTEKLNRAIDTVIENTADEESANALKIARTLNDTERYEAEGGNKNSLQRRLSALAREIDENNMAIKGEKYDTRRDMLAVAQAADNFVKTRLDDALAIINGQMAEVEGLYKEDLYTALERLAVENGDLGLIDELKNSEVANRLAKELGQRVAGFRNFKQSTDLDVVSALKSLDNKFNEALKNKKAQKEFDSALKLLDDSIKQQDKIADKELDSFLEELKCK